MKFNMKEIVNSMSGLFIVFSLLYTCWILFVGTVCYAFSMFMPIEFSLIYFVKRLFFAIMFFFVFFYIMSKTDTKEEEEEEEENEY